MAAIQPDQPFALLANAGTIHLFTQPHGTIAGHDMQKALAKVRQATQSGDWVAGGISYESGLLLEPRLQPLVQTPPFHWFGCFPPPRELNADDLARLLSPWRTAIDDPVGTPAITREDWRAMIAQAQDYITAGDIYQVNLSFPLHLSLDCHPLALFARIFTLDAAPHGGIVHDGEGRWWLSFSPELFFQLADGKLQTRPMKGTAARGRNCAEDKAAAEFLAQDTKNRAENLMITDLLRNDLGRIATVGSVQTSRLFAIETYPSVHQMTSTVTARLAPGLDAVDALRALFPCGSVTGAPKIRAMEIISELEHTARGIYCGSLGWIAPRARAANFNVAIRTITIDQNRDPRAAVLGLGAAITADSDADAEWAECLLKGQFLRPSAPESLIETLHLPEGGQIPRLSLHLDRMADSARRFGFAFDRPAVEAQLLALATDIPRRLRLMLHPDGKITLKLYDLPAVPDVPVNVAIVPLPLDPVDWRLCHKVGERDFHDTARRTSGAFECVYLRPDGLLTEGSFSNIFVEREGVLLTPPASLGLLPGVLRAELLQSGRAREAVLRPKDLAAGFLLGNSLRGLWPAQLAG